MKRDGAVWRDTLQKNKKLLLLFVVMTVANLTVFLMYRLFIEAFLYAEIICACLLVMIFFADFLQGLKRQTQMQGSLDAVKNGSGELPLPETLSEQTYGEMIDVLLERINALRLAYDSEKQDEQDWYTAWVHQIKTPIAVLKLKVSPDDKEILRELFRIEEYADMALSYIRVGSTQNDLVIREYALDELICETLRKYAPLFIAKKIKLAYEPTDKTVVTDKKWLQCILEQYVSNAVKYTSDGSVSITYADNVLTVADTGVGIADEDLPRVFEKGYTGINGRGDAKSSGLGLYLSQKAAGLIGVRLTVQSTLGAGSRFSIIFPKQA